MNLRYAAIFDMDGVLVDTYEAHYLSWVRMAEPEGLLFTEADFASTFGRTSRETIFSVWGDEHQFDDARVAKLDELKEIAFREIIAQDFPAMPGVTELLKALHADGFKLAVGSSGPSENIELVLDRLGIAALFDGVVTGSDVARGKPDPQVFLTAAERVDISPRRCVVIEDAPAGIAAAHAAEMVCVGLASTGRTRDELAAAELVVDTLNELSPETLRKVIGSAR